MYGLVTALTFLAFFPQVEETVTVQRLMVELRIVTQQGKAITGLHVDDFAAKVDGKPVEIVSATWVSETAEPEPDAAYLDALAQFNDLRPSDSGRLFILFFQTDFGRAGPYVKGQMSFMRYAKKIVERLPPHDRVAVMSFDSQLRLHLDFTTDRAQIERAMDRTLHIGEPPAAPAVPEPSLAACLDRAAARRATSVEDALLVLANAVAEIPAVKQVVVLGHGLGERTGGRYALGRNWEAARKRLIEAQVVVNAVYTTSGGGPLALGLQEVTAQTGGFFTVAGSFGSQVVQRFEQGELAGHYEVELRAENEIAPGPHHAEVYVKRTRTRYESTLVVSGE
jgi:VWFA-related protein